MELEDLSRVSRRPPARFRSDRSRRDRYERDDRVGNRLLRSPARWCVGVALVGMLVLGEYLRTFEPIGHRWYPSPLQQAALGIVVALPVACLALFARTRALRTIGAAVLLAGACFHLVNGSTPLLALLSIGSAIAALCLAVTGPEVRG